MREKMHRLTRNKVDYGTVLWYLRLQELRNSQLRGTDALCDMCPHDDKVACKTCPEFKKCGEALARRCVLKKNSKKGRNRRKRKTQNPKRNVDPAWIYEDYEVEQSLDDEEGLGRLEENSIFELN